MSTFIVYCIYRFVLAMYMYVHDMYVYVLHFHRYLGLFGDHIVPAVLYRYTQVLRCEDLVSSKGKSLLTTARLEAVWKRLADRFTTVVETPP